MFKIMLLMIPALLLGVSKAGAGGVDVHVGIDVPLPGFYVAPAPVYVAPPPVVVRRAPVVVAPAPVVVRPRRVVVVERPTVVEYRHVHPRWVEKHYHKRHP
ncbi:MAG: hypothetical protein GX433_09295 [Deltaproteobacteria bacterium]|nr:hypothetical protein [Deltaproteobacteria bacterium]